MTKEQSLKKRGIARMGSTLVVLAGLLFLPAGSWRYWQGGLFLLLMTGFWSYFFVDFMKHDPQLLERRLQAKEIHPEQKVFQRLHSAILFAGFILAPLDFRFGWSRALGSVPIAMVLAAQAMVVIGYLIVYRTMKTNSFAASIIRVEEGQSVIDVGPYARVRHPMYLGMAIAELAAPFALGSYIAFPIFALLVPLLIYRLVHEERTLCRDLAGYSEYCGRKKFRLIPGVW